MQSSYLEQKLERLNQNLHGKFEDAFRKQTHVSSKFIGERRIKSRIGSRVSLFPSIKNKGLICLESNLELVHAISLERNEDVLEYRTQAIQIFITEKQYIIPDFIIRTLNGYEVHEIKPNLKTISERNFSRFQIAEEILKSHCIKFKTFDRNNLLSKQDYLFLNISYQRANYKILNKSDLDKAEIIINNAKFKSREDLYLLMQSNNLNSIIADHFIFYKKILGV
ncbi:TnsA endonuclease N-terminal domain-containing protein [Acinetobacter sp. NS-4]|uniref:TnsA endonuclease N-terminal domain-containing protein n=1 Tax=Acinetobacter sp. NS-4 TaxID=3127956 RepID=UPI00307F48FD